MRVDIFAWSWSMTTIRLNNFVIYLLFSFFFGIDDLEEAPHHFVLSFFLVVEENKSLGIAQVRAFLGNSSDSLKKGSSGLVAKKKKKKRKEQTKRERQTKKNKRKTGCPAREKGRPSKMASSHSSGEFFFKKEKEHKVPMKMKCFLFFRRFFFNIYFTFVVPRLQPWELDEEGVAAAALAFC